MVVWSAAGLLPAGRASRRPVSVGGRRQFPAVMQAPRTESVENTSRRVENTSKRTAEILPWPEACLGGGVVGPVGFEPTLASS